MEPRRASSTYVAWIATSLMIGTAVLSSQIGAEAAYPGVNGRIAFVSYASGDAGIFTMQADGTDVNSLVDGGWSPFWSPDGSKVAYTLGQDLLVVKVNPDGTADGEPVNLTHVTNASVLRGYASWSPDGTKLVYERWSDKNKFDIWVAEPNLETGDLENEVRLTNTRAWNRAPAWSPDGSLIAFSSDRDGDSEIYVMPASGEEPGVEATPITDNSVDDGTPDWSPDGAQILLTRFQSRKGKVTNTDIYRVPSDPSDGAGTEVQLTMDAAPDFAADWSPDGQLIAFVRGSGAAAEIYTMGAVQGEADDLTRLTENGYGDLAPDWQTVAAPPPPPTEPCLLDVCL